MKKKIVMIALAVSLFTMTGTGVSAADAEYKTISVVGSSKEYISPDIATIAVEIETEGDTVESCQSENAEKTSAVVKFIKDSGVPESSIITTYNLSAVHDWEHNGKISGYTMTTGIEVSNISLEDVGTLTSGMVSSGANNINHISFASTEYDKAYLRALEDANKMAREKAEVLAKANGKEIVDILSVDETGYSDYGKSYTKISSLEYAAEESMDVGSMAVEAGELEVNAKVTVVFVLDD